MNKQSTITLLTLVFIFFITPFLLLNAQKAPSHLDSSIEPKWKKSTAFDIAGTPTVYQDQIIFATRDGFLYCLTSTGQTIWEKKITDSILSAPSITPDGTILISSGTGQILSYTITGEKKLEVNVNTPFRATPLYDGIHVYAVDEEGLVYAIDPKTQKIIWQTPLNAQVFTSPAFMKKKNLLLIPTKEYFLIALDTTGKIIWKFNAGGVLFSSPAVTSNGDIFLTSMNHHIYKISPEGKSVYSFKTTYWNRTSPVWDDKGNVYFGSYDGYFYCLNANGRLKWKTKGNLRFETDPVIDSKGTIYCGDNKGIIYAFTPEGKIKWTHQISGLIKCGFAIHPKNQLLLVPGADRNLYAFPIK